ncbi:hypothetical protein OPQ81_011126 [Rhizoctonia solani]|nr:hypothetical protein OPQ81_011126 [Rhizoctonia solani]
MILLTVFKNYSVKIRLHGPSYLRGKQSLEDLKTADDLLEESLKLLNGIKDGLTTRHYTIYRSKHNQLYLMVVEVKSDVRQREQRTRFFSGKEEQDKFHSHVQLLLQYCQAYHTDVVNASRKVHAQPQASSQPVPESIQTAFGIQASTSPSIIPNVSIGMVFTQDYTCEAEMMHGRMNDTGSEPPMLNNGAHVTHSCLLQKLSSGQHLHMTTVPSHAGLSIRYACGRPIFAGVSQSSPAAGENSSAPSPGSNSYTRILTCTSEKTKTILIQLDYRPDKDDVERLSEDMIQFADKIVRGGLDRMENFNPMDQTQGLSWISSILSSFASGTANPGMGVA